MPCSRSKLACEPDRAHRNLYHIILSTRSRDPSGTSLLEYLGFKYLSKSGIIDFCDRIASSLSILPESIWARLCYRILDGVSHASPRIAEIYCPYTDNPLNGIIAYLVDVSQENVHDLGIVRVPVSSTHD
jgi:hypothetical protein